MNFKRYKETLKKKKGNSNTKKNTISEIKIHWIWITAEDTAEERSVNLKTGQTKLFKLKHREKKDTTKNEHRIKNF